MSPLAHLFSPAKSMGVVGGGTMGVGIVYVFAAAGWNVWVVEPDDTRSLTLQKTLEETATAGLKRGKLNESNVAHITKGVQRLRSADELPLGLDLVIETVPERMDIKKVVLGQIDARLPSIIASNTSAMSINELAKCVKDPSCFLGMHFFNPVWSLAMVELIRGDATSTATLNAAQSYSDSIGKQASPYGMCQDLPLAA